MLPSEVSYSKRLIQCTCAIFWCLLSGGPIFGFAALKPILIKEHVYEYLCDVHTPIFTSFNSNNDNNDIIAKCTEQDLKLNMMFTVAAMLTNVSALAIGRILDVYGPKVCGLIGAFFLYLACFVFIYSKYLVGSIIDPYLLGYSFLALGGPFAFISSFQLSNSFPKSSGTILALITGAFDASSAVFYCIVLVIMPVWAVLHWRSFSRYTCLFQLYCRGANFYYELRLYQTEGTSKLCANDEENHGHVASPVSSNDQETTPLLSEPATRTRRDSMGDAIKHPYEIEGEEFWLSIQVECLVLCTDTRHKNKSRVGGLC